MPYIKLDLTSGLFNANRAIIPNGSPSKQHGDVGTIAKIDPAIQT
jgi:hypothetical protein